MKMDHFRDVWILRGKYVAFLLMGEHFRRSPAFSVPESAQRWANQVRQEGEVEAVPESAQRWANQVRQEGEVEA